MTAALAMVGLLWRRLQRDRLGLALTFALPVAVAIVRTVFFDMGIS